MSAKYLKTFIAFGVLVALVGGMYFYNRHAAKKKAATTPTKQKQTLINVQPADVVAFTLAPSGGKPFTVSKVNGDWAINGPTQFAASPSQVGAFLQSLTSATIDEVVAKAPTDLSEYGLNTPAETIELTTRVNKTPVSVSLGDETPTSSGIYAQVAGNPRVVLIADYLKSSLEKSLFDLRDKRVVTLAESAIDRLSVDHMGKTTTLEKNQAGIWGLATTPPVRAKHLSIETMLDDLTSLRMKSIVSEHQSDLARYGFNQPEMTIRLSAGSDSQTLTLGKKSGTTYNAMNNALDPVFTVDDYFVSDFTKDPSTLREKALFTFSPYEAKKLVIVSAAGKRVFEKLKNQWMETSPGSKKETGTTVEDLLDGLTDLRAESFPTKDSTDLASYGFNQPTDEFTVTYGPKNKIQTLEIASVGKRLYARRGSDLVPSELAADALASVNEDMGKL